MSQYALSIPGLSLLNRGKVRDVYAVGDDKLLIDTTDRLSAFDVVLRDPIPGKGGVLTRLSKFWMDRVSNIVPNHSTDISLAEVVGARQATQLGDRAVVVRRFVPLPVEAIVRGYLIGSGWSDYQKTGSICGISLPSGLVLADRLPETLFTPSTKAAVGDHDQNIGYEEMVVVLANFLRGFWRDGRTDSAIQAEAKKLAEEVKIAAVHIYTECAEYARQRGIIIADTKFEFGLDRYGVLHLIDEVLTPDSSRFWPADQYCPGVSPPSYDKQIVRDYLESVGWNKKPPGPILPPEIIQRTRAQYLAVERILTTKPVD